MEAAVQQPPRRANLFLHCGAQSVERERLDLVPTPESTQTWMPIPHMALVQEVERVLEVNALKIVNQAHSLTGDGLRYFGLMQIQNGQSHDDYAWVLGLRNSHDKRFPAGIVVGASVFVCDNLSFSGEIRLSRKHTRFIVRDLPSLTQKAIGRLSERWNHQDERIDAYKGSTLSNSAAHDLVIRAMDVDACTLRQIPQILGEWRKPEHEEFQPRTLWSLFNSFTQVFKGGNLNTLSGRTEALHGLLDSYVGLN